MAKGDPSYFDEIVLAGFSISPVNCRNHRDHEMGYSEFFDYCDKMAGRGVTQIQCLDCGLWVFPAHWNKRALRKQRARKKCTRANCEKCRGGEPCR